MTGRNAHPRRAPLAHALPEPLALEAVALGLELGQAGLEAGVALERAALSRACPARLSRSMSAASYRREVSSSAAYCRRFRSVLAPDKACITSDLVTY